MNLLSIEHLSKSYGERVLFEDISLGIEEGNKIGLIGVNGTGKSTFLKIIAGVETVDAGKISAVGGLTVEYLPQNPAFDEGQSVLAQVFKADTPMMKVIREYEDALEQMNKYPGDKAWEASLINLSQQMDAMDAWHLESDAKAILTKLGISNFSDVIGNLSGGQKKRVAMARALINPADLLILDEPTNHVDNDTVTWLEEFLYKRKGALLMVTHDRYFLDRVANRIIELDKGRLYSYTGNYSNFLEAKAAREELEQVSEQKRQNLLRKELAWIKRGARARSTKQKARIDRFEQLSSQENENSDANLEIASIASRLGKKIIELEHISHGFGDQECIRDFSYILLKDDRVGIVGPNGSGKSTLLDIIAGRLSPAKGEVERGQTVKVGYFSQGSTEINEEIRVIDYIKETANYLTVTDGNVISAAQMLERFLFPANRQWMPISKLSGGEKRRLYLLKVLMEAPNILLLDEPTNDLDIQTLTILEDYLDHFAGAVIIVSHDRYLLDRLVNKVFAFEGNGVITQYVGGYSEYKESITSLEPQNLSDEKRKEPSKRATNKLTERSRKMSFKEQREFEEIDNIIADAEDELRMIKARMNAAGCDFQLLQELASAQQQLEHKLDELLDRWTYLNELAEEINNKN